jgi:hypothetical protein
MKEKDHITCPKCSHIYLTKYGSKCPKCNQEEDKEE